MKNLLNFLLKVLLYIIEIISSFTRYTLIVASAYCDKVWRGLWLGVTVI